MNKERESYSYLDYEIIIFNLSGLHNPPFIGKAVKNGRVKFSSMNIESGMVYDELVASIDKEATRKD